MNLDLLDHAWRLLQKGEGPEGVWPRAVALLARQALEEALDRLWMSTYPGTSRATRTTQLACMGLVIKDAGLVADTRSVWSSLSRACHHHHYELGPTAPELHRWILQVERLVESLRPEPPEG